jgi:Glucuronyl esterase, fungi
MTEPHHRRAFLSGLASISLSVAARAQALSRIDHTNLLLYHDRRGSIQPVTTVNQWLQRRAEIVNAMQQIMGPLPGAQKKCPLDMRVEREEEVKDGAYIRRLISYAAEPGGRVPAYLLIPKSVLDSKRRAAAVLCPHPTDAKLGHKIVVGLGGQPNRQYAAELAARGYVTLAPSYPLLADYNPDLKALGYQSGTMKAVWDNMRGLDLLETLPFVRKGPVATIGHSLGGHNSVYTAVFDNRIRVVVSSCGLDSYRDYKNGDIRGWTSDRYMPKLLAYRDKLEEIPFDFHEMIGALAPKVCFVSAPMKDDNFKWQSVDRVIASAKQVYRLYGKESNLIVEHPDCTHDFPDEMRQKAYQLIDQHLR